MPRAFFGGKVELVDHVVVTPEPTKFMRIRANTMLWERQEAAEKAEAAKLKRKRAPPRAKRTPEQEAGIREAIMAARRMS